MSRDLRARVERETGPLPRCLLYVGGVLVRDALVAIKAAEDAADG